MQDLLTLSMFGGFVGFVAATLVLLFLFFYAEHEKQGFIAFVAVVAYLIANHYWGNVPIKSLFSWFNVSVYLGTGLVYAVIKTYSYGRSVAADGGSLDRAVDELKGHVFRWWFIWPVSLISWLVSDFIVEGFELLWDNIGNSFRKILAAGYQSKKKVNPNQ